MNFLHRKSGLFVRQYTSYVQIKNFLNRIRFIKSVPTKAYSSLCLKKQLLFSATTVNNNSYRCLYDAGDSNEDDLDNADIEDFLPYDDTLQQQSVRDLLYPNSEDPSIIKLNQCPSIEEVFSFIKESAKEMQYEHVAQTVLVLWDLQKLFFYAHQINRTVPSDKVVRDYVSQLTSHPEFHRLLELITVNFNKFDTESLGCVLLYLNKMGLIIEHDVLQLLIAKLLDSLPVVSLSTLSRFIVTVSSEHNLKSILMVQDTVPIIIKELEQCESAENLKLITICLNHLQHVVTTDLLEKYMDKVKEFVNKGLLTSKHHRTLLKVIMFLSYPRWGDNNTILISELMLLLKDNIHQLGLLDFFIAYEVLYKHYEPGELLTEMQRCASKTLLHLEEDSSLSPEARLKLLSCMVCFSSPLHRPEYERMITKLVKEPLSKYSMFDLLRILTFIKPSNEKLCEAFWDNILETARSQEIFKDTDVLLKLCQKYMNYSSDIHYRHKEFERQMLKWIYHEFENGIMELIPSKLAMAASFILAYEDNPTKINHILQKIIENWEQLNHADCLYISKGVRTAVDITKNPLVTATHLKMINQVLNKSISQKLILMTDTAKVNFLLKSYIYRRHFDRKMIDSLLLMVKSDQKLSSNLIRNIIFSLQATNGLLPDVIDNIADYIINYRDNLLGFNVEKFAYLCYHLGYSPRHSDELFQAVTNVIIRDQERISGLSYIHAALSLCFFNKLPDSFIKQIFNVAFLEKLDTELANCYFKDIYPIRVRHSMMQLNRAVCLDYPQSNVPWFHQKYVEQLHSKVKKKPTKDIETESNIKHYLLKVIEDPSYLLEDVTTAYGYHVDFVIHLDNQRRAIDPTTTNENETKVAISLMRPSAYTNINKQLRGQYQFKKRHLEILGYKVLTVDLSEWNSLIYGEEKMEYFNKVIGSRHPTNQYSIIS